MKAFVFIFGLGFGFWLAGLYTGARRAVALETPVTADVATAAPTAADDPNPPVEADAKRTRAPRTARSVPG